MINSIQRDQRRRILFLKFAVKRVQYKALSQNGLLSSFQVKGKNKPFLGIRKEASVNKKILGSVQSKKIRTQTGVEKFVQEEEFNTQDIENNSIKNSNTKWVTKQRVRAENEHPNNSQTDLGFPESLISLRRSVQRRIPKERTFKIPRNASLTRVQNRCILTARSRSVLRFCKLSRIRLRELASQGLLSGVSKASW